MGTRIAFITIEELRHRGALRRVPAEHAEHAALEVAGAQPRRDLWKVLLSWQRAVAEQELDDCVRLCEGAVVPAREVGLPR